MKTPETAPANPVEPYVTELSQRLALVATLQEQLDEHRLRIKELRGIIHGAKLNAPAQ
ncbi:hypothetical protein [Caulobacter vibrioides]|uniref:Uncharacterized protein n=1 Tax=Caulobacter phage S2B TaxID=2759120 RepID=A0AAE7ML52_9CAUD|nr:hypothetical protein [Caulobacter vibrioides]QOC54126.1 hypothetical protein [Caulobacter phage S2B]QXZ50195.1 hypothetical protein KZH45_09690 [Caulobacter vibrioides]